MRKILHGRKELVGWGHAEGTILGAVAPGGGGSGGSGRGGPGRTGGGGVGGVAGGFAGSSCVTAQLALATSGRDRKTQAFMTPSGVKMTTASRIQGILDTVVMFNS